MDLVPPPGRISRGEIWLRKEQKSDPINLRQLPKKRMQKYRGGQIGMIFQEPMSSLNPVYTCGFQLTEAIRLHQNISEKEARRQAVARLQEVKLLPSDEELQQRYIDNWEQIAGRSSWTSASYSSLSASKNKLSSIAIRMNFLVVNCNES
jgi:peptide/nickel transport system ATP-binding protein